MKIRIVTEGAGLPQGGVLAVRRRPRRRDHGGGAGARDAQPRPQSHRRGARRHDQVRQDEMQMRNSHSRMKRERDKRVGRCRQTVETDMVAYKFKDWPNGPNCTKERTELASFERHTLSMQHTYLCKFWKQRFLLPCQHAFKGNRNITI